MKVDNNAPLVAKKEGLISAPIDLVWKIQSDINHWPSWQKEISYAKLLGKLATGTAFEWKAMGMNISSILEEVVDNKIIGWSGKSIGMTAVHIWKLEKQGNKTKVTTEESLSGWFPQLIKLFQPNFLDQSLSKALSTLKTEAENKKLT